jgi:ubiquinone/menaquinone biosynthesis C-methylase UbiE
LTSGFAETWRRGQQKRDEVLGAATEMMLQIANLRPGDRVLDVAAGTGDQTLMAARLVGATGYVLATDISAGMLKVATDTAREEGLANVETRVMDAESVELDADSFDAVICRTALMHFPDPAKALNGMRRAVKVSGKVAVMVFSTAEKNPYHGLPLAIVRRLARMPSAPQGHPGMFALGGSGVLESTYKQAGFLDATVHAVSVSRVCPSIEGAIRVLRDSFPRLQALLAQLNDADRERAWKEIEQQLSQFDGPNGFEVPGEMLIGVGTK